MKINGSPERIQNDGGDYVLLVDNGSEGLTVYCQYETLEEAVAGVATVTYAPAILVKLVEIEAVER